MRRIVLWYKEVDAVLTCIQLFDKNGVQILEVGYNAQLRIDHASKFKETILQDGERIIGVKSRLHTYAQHHDFQFVIGKLTLE